MRPVLSRQQIRAFDEDWMKRGVPGIVLMENAGRGAAHIIGLKARPYSKSTGPTSGSIAVGSCLRCADEASLAGLCFVLLCGAGNNGGDGFVVARHLARRGATLRVYCLAAPGDLSGDARIAASCLNALGISILALPEKSEWPDIFEKADIIVDALLGTGADRAVQGVLRDLILSLNESPVSVLSLDLPSGLDADTGAKLGVVVQALHTITFGHLKRGLFSSEGHRASGTISLCNLGVPASLPSCIKPVAWLLEEEDIRAQLPQRSPALHKNEAGRVVVVAGSPGTTGAARLVGRACLRAGAGVVTLSSDPETTAKLDTELVELMSQAWGTKDGLLFASAGALVLGPGLGQGKGAIRAIEEALKAARPTVLDADALRWLGSLDRREARLKLGGALAVLTPHPGEAAGLLGCGVPDIESDRFGAVERLAQDFGATVVLKGSRTLIATPGQSPVVCAFGSPALATAGSGDVLAGMLGALLVGASDQTEVFERTQLAVALHAMSAERWSSQRGDRGLLASEIADAIPHLLKDLRSTG